MTGLPVLPAVCLTWCGEHRTTIGFCHDEAVKNGLPTVTAATDSCTALLTDGTFVREDTRPVLHAVHTLLVFGPAALRTKAPVVAGSYRGVTHVPLKQPLVLRV